MATHAWQVGDPCRLTVLQMGKVYKGVIEDVSASSLCVRVETGQLYRVPANSSFITRPSEQAMIDDA